MTRDGIARTDILAVNVSEQGRRRPLEIQVKTSTTVERHSWLLGEVKPAESPYEWFIFVGVGHRLRDDTRSFVVPRLHAQAASWIGHRHWRGSDSVPVGTRNAQLGRSRPDVSVFAGYEEQWTLLKQDADTAPVLLPGWMRSEATRPKHILPADHQLVPPLPPGHPWNEHLPSLEQWPGEVKDAAPESA